MVVVCDWSRKVASWKLLFMINHKLLTVLSFT